MKKRKKMKIRILFFVIFILAPINVYSVNFVLNRNNGFGGWSICENLYKLVLEILPKNKTILELGSGAGTKQLCKHYKVYSIEHNPKFLNLYQTNYIYAPIKNSWYDTEILKKKLPKHYDLILVDGPPGSIGRDGFYKFIKLFKQNVPIIIDDVNRKAEFLLMEKVASLLKRKSQIFICGNKKFALLS